MRRSYLSISTSVSDKEINGLSKRLGVPGVSPAELSPMHPRQSIA